MASQIIAQVPPPHRPLTSADAILAELAAPGMGKSEKAAYLTGLAGQYVALYDPKGQRVELQAVYLQTYLDKGFTTQPVGDQTAENVAPESVSTKSVEPQTRRTSSRTRPHDEDEKPSDAAPPQTPAEEVSGFPRTPEVPPETPAQDGLGEGAAH